MDDGDRRDKTTDTPEQQVQQKLKEVKRYAVGVREALEQARETEWIIEGMLPKASLVILAGPPKTAGKSLLTMALSIAVAKGGTFLGHRCQRGKVVYINMEDGIRRIGMRMEHFGLRKGIDDDLPLIIIHDSNGLQVTLETLEAMNPPPALVIIDPAIYAEIACGVDNENDSLKVAKFMSFLRRAAQGSGACLLLSHHYAKTTGAMRGSSAFESGSDGWWDFVPGRNDLRYIHGTLRDGPPFEMGVALRYDQQSVALSAIDVALAKPYDSRWGGDKRPRDKDNELYMRICHVLQQAEGKPLSRTRIQEGVRTCYGEGDRIGIGVPKANELLARLQEEGLAENGPGGWKWRYATESTWQALSPPPAHELAMDDPDPDPAPPAPTGNSQKEPEHAA